MIGLCVLMGFPDVTWIAQFVTVMIVITTVYSGIEYFIQNWKCLWD
jgi:phosphatidylglycerophosphate synthase